MKIVPAISLLALGACSSPPAKEAASCRLVQVASIPATVTRTNTILIPVGINGAQVMFAADTGAGLSVLFAGPAERMGLAPRALEGGRAIGLNGETTLYQARINEFSLGDLIHQTSSFSMAVVGTKQISENLEAVGLLGSDYFRHFDLEFDLAHGRINMFLHHACPDRVAYWAPEILIQSPFSFENRHINIPVTINGETGNAILDSGAYGTAMTWQEARRFGITRDTPGIEAAGGMHGLGDRKVNAFHYLVPSITIGDETIKGVPTQLYSPVTEQRPAGDPISNPTAQFPMLLGADFLVRNRVYIAYDEKKLYFSPYTYKLAPAAAEAAK